MKSGEERGVLPSFLSHLPPTEADPKCGTGDETIPGFSKLYRPIRFSCYTGKNTRKRERRLSSWNLLWFNQRDRLVTLFLFQRHSVLTLFLGRNNYLSQNLERNRKKNSILDLKFCRIFRIIFRKQFEISSFFFTSCNTRTEPDRHWGWNSRTRKVHPLLKINRKFYYNSEIELSVRRENLI